jgi:hypothetical protein
MRLYVWWFERHTAGGMQENVCNEWEISEEENGEVIATNGYEYCRTHVASREEALSAVTTH